MKDCIIMSLFSLSLAIIMVFPFACDVLEIEIEGHNGELYVVSLMVFPLFAMTCCLTSAI